MAKTQQLKAGVLSRLWAGRVVDWQEHLTRKRNGACWSALLQTLRSPLELAERRAEAGRPGTRIQSGFARARWCESVQTAREYLT